MKGRPGKVSEKEFLGQVIDLARHLGWRCVHFRPARTLRGWRTPLQGDGVGFPDLLLVKHRLIVAETKVPPNGPTPEQALWLAALRAAGVDARLWTPAMWPEIEAVLGERS